MLSNNPTQEFQRSEWDKDFHVPVAIWCPQGRDSLPLAAKLCCDSFPSEWIVWSSDEQTPQEPLGVEARIWIVFCVDDSPEPPDWRERVGGTWAIFPGSAQRWSCVTSSSTHAWRPDIVLSDLLPDEQKSSVWMELLKAMDIAWLPTAVEKVFEEKDVISLGIVSDIQHLRPLWGALSAAFGSEQTHVISGFGDRDLLNCPVEKVLIATRDPVLVGVGSQWAGKSGCKPVFWGESIGELRAKGLGVEPAAVVYPMDEARRLSSGFRNIVRTLSSELTAPRATSLNWRTWLSNLFERSMGTGETDPFQQAKSIVCGPDWGKWESAWICVAGTDHPPVVPQVGSRRSLAALIRQVENSSDLNHCCELMREYLEQFPSGLSQLTEIGIEIRAGNMATALFVGVADAHILGGRSEIVSAAAKVFNGAIQEPNAPPSWKVWDCVANALLGRMEIADAKLSGLLERNPALYSWALGAVARAWIPAFGEDQKGLSPAESIDWWKAHMLHCGKSVGLEGWQLGAWTLAVLGDHDGAEMCWQNVCSAQPAAQAQSVLAAWLFGCEQEAKRWYDCSFPDFDSGSALGRLTISLANSILCPRGEESVQIVRAMDDVCPTLFDRTYPSHLRCLLRAIAHRRNGDEVEAERWYGRAASESTLSTPMRTAWNRAMPT